MTHDNMSVPSDALSSAALRYAQNGVHVFPLRVSVKLDKDGNPKKDVTPVADWDGVSTTDAGTLTAWFASKWWNGIGIDCGKSGLVVVDLDGMAAVEWWAKIESAHGLPATWRVRTRRGDGQHAIYRANPDKPVGNSASELHDEVDTRGRGGFIIAPPTAYEGGSWGWIEGEPDWAVLPTVPDLVPNRLGIKIPIQRESRDSDDPFATSSSLSTQRAYTPEKALRWAEDYGLAQLRTSELYKNVNTALNTAALTLAHFDVFWTAEQQDSMLLDAMSHLGFAELDEDDQETIASARRKAAGDWRAVRTAEEPAPPPAVVETEPGEETLSTLEKLRRRLMTADELADAPNPEPLVMGLLDLDTESWLIGAPGSLKSFIALDLAGHVATGLPWQGHAVHRGSVLYLAAEGVRGMTLRTRAWRKVHGSMRGVTFLPYPVKVLSNDGQWEALTQIARELRPVLIVIDTQARVTVGLEENNAKDMGVFIAAVGALKRATGACVLVVHHTGRNGGDARGSSALDGAQDTELKVIRAAPRSSLICKLQQDKQKDMAEGETGGVELALEVVDLGQDAATGRDLSSLVLMGLQRAAFHLAEDRGNNDTRPWLPTFHHRDRWKRTILNALYDFAPEGYGLTKAEVRSILVKSAGLSPKSSSFEDAWKAVLELKDPQGEGVVVKVGGERYDLASLPVLEALRDEHGPRGSASG